MKCNYGEHLNWALWDQFVCGPNNPKIQNNIELVNTGDLMFKKACSIAETMEIADRNTQEFTLQAVKPFDGARK